MNTDLINRLQQYGKRICWHPAVTLDAIQQQLLHDLLTEAAALLSTPSHPEKEQAAPKAIAITERAPEFPCWLYCLGFRGWRHASAQRDQFADDTHWHPEQPTAPLLAPTPGPGVSTPDSTLPPLSESPKRTMLVEIRVSEDFEKRLDNQWEVEREIHADRWKWHWDSDYVEPYKQRIEYLEHQNTQQAVEAEKSPSPVGTQAGWVELREALTQGIFGRRVALGQFEYEQVSHVIDLIQPFLAVEDGKDRELAERWDAEAERLLNLRDEHDDIWRRPLENSANAYKNCASELRAARHSSHATTTRGQG